jgi:hypothetical protein
MSSSVHFVCVRSLIFGGQVCQTVASVSHQSERLMVCVCSRLHVFYVVRSVVSQFLAIVAWSERAFSCTFVWSSPSEPLALSIF